MVTTVGEIAAYTIADFARAFRIGRTKVYAEISAGRLVARKSGKRTLILLSDAEHWAANLTTVIGRGQS